MEEHDTAMKEKLKNIRCKLLDKVEWEVEHQLCTINAAELGEVVDILKDIEEIMYYHTVTKAIHEKYFPIEDLLPSDVKTLTK